MNCRTETGEMSAAELNCRPVSVFGWQILTSRPLQELDKKLKINFWENTAFYFNLLLREQADWKVVCKKKKSGKMRQNSWKGKRSSNSNICRQILRECFYMYHFGEGQVTQIIVIWSHRLPYSTLSMSQLTMWLCHKPATDSCLQSVHGGVQHLWDCVSVSLCAACACDDGNHTE